MVELAAKNDIEVISIDLLKQARALDVFPTPVDRIVRFAELILDVEVDLSQVHPSFLTKVSDNFLSIWHQVRGFLDRSEKTIYLDLSQLPSRQNFVKLHEVGHQVLPWQSQIMQYMDNDETLSRSTQEEFEAEANYFSSVTLFQHDRFTSEMEKLDLSLKAGMALGKKFGGSAHAALRRMVEHSPKRCALLVLKNVPTLSFLDMECGKRDLFQSRSFTAEFGALPLPDVFDYEWPFAQDYLNGRRFREDGEVVLETANGKTLFSYHFLNNTYNGFVFLFPLGEHQPSRTKIVIRQV